MRITPKVDRRYRSVWRSGSRSAHLRRLLIGWLEAPARHGAEAFRERAEDGRDSAQKPFDPHARSPEHRTCQVARRVHTKVGMCTCRVCISERLFLRILALLVA